jgi:hypothetical protein
MILPSFPRCVTSLGCGSGRRSTRRGKCPRLIQDPFSNAECDENPAALSNQFAAKGRFEFQKCRQLFIGLYNEPVSVAAMWVNNPDRSPLRING